MHVSTAWNPGSLVSARITPLRLEAFEQLPKHARRCVFWEVDPATLGSRRSPRRPRVREGSVAVDGHARVGVVRPDRGDVRPARRRDDPAMPTRRRAVPRATRSTLRRVRCRARGCFPTGPVSADAVLLTSMGVESGARRRRRCPHSLIAPVVGDLVRRGVRALEAFGRTADGCRVAGPATGVARAAAGASRRSATARSTSASSTPTSCRTSGFVVVAPHRVLPAAAARARAGPGLEGRSGGGVGAAAGKRAAAAAGRGRRESTRCTRTVRSRLTRPACSTDSSWASSSAKVKVPVGRSFLPSRYSRLTAARMPSAIESRVWRGHQHARGRADW